MRHWRLLSTVIAVVAFSVVIASQTPSGHAVFEQALAKERVEGNLPEAIRLYERVVAEFASDRALAARALLQAGRAYEKLAKGQPVVFRMSLPTGEWTTIASPTKAYSNTVEWNDDGTAFYVVRYSTEGEQNGILRRSVEGGPEELLYAVTPSAVPPRNLEISPDRRWLAFNTASRGNAECLTVR